jgi:hypothetical protein
MYCMGGWMRRYIGEQKRKVVLSKRQHGRSLLAADATETIIANNATTSTRVLFACDIMINNNNNV